jgi:hypothetical protein
MAMESQCREEVLQLHRFIEKWLTGAIDQSEQAFARLEQALAYDFVVVQPSGIKEDKQKVLQNFRGAYATKVRPFKIAIRNVDSRLVAETLCVVSYEEWHLGIKKNGRISTALLRRRLGGDELEWLHLHETAFRECLAV